MIILKSVFNKDKNNYFYNIFLEKASCLLPKKIIFCLKYKCYIMIELTFLRELIRETNYFNEKSESKRCDICHYCHFLNIRFRFQPNVCNGCHGLLKMLTSLSDFAILNTGADYCCIFR